MSFQDVIAIRAPRIVAICSLLISAAVCGISSQAADKAPTGAKPPIDPTHDLYRPLELAYKSRDALQEVKDYEAIFSKKERMGAKLKQTTMRMKFREQPFSVYLLFVSPKTGPKNPDEGREVIFVEGKNGNKLMVHETGVKSFVGTMSLDPKSPTALSTPYHIKRVDVKIFLKSGVQKWCKCRSTRQSP